jgi:hypothetical protein
LNQFSRILLEEDDGHTNDVVVDDGDDDVDDNDDSDPVELFQKRGKWWELIVWLLGIMTAYDGFFHLLSNIAS